MSDFRAKVFISYCHDDKQFLCALQTHLGAYSEPFDVFTDNEVPCGDPINKEIQANLSNADIAVFLVSPTFLTSTECRKEWDEATRQNKIRIPVIIRDCNWRELLKSSDNPKAILHEGKPVQNHENDSAWVAVCQGVVSRVTEVVSSIEPTKEFIEELEETEFLSQDDIKLSDMFVFPNLRLSDDDVEIEGDRIKNERDLLEQNYVLVHGEESSGKTALAKHMCMHLVKENQPVLYIDLENVSASKVNESIFSDEYKKRFKGDYSLWKKRPGKVAIIENMSKSEREKTRERDINIAVYALRHFDKVIITLGSDVYDAYMRTEERAAEFSTVEIHPFLHGQQEKLIIKRLNASGEDVHDNQVNHIENRINLVINTKIMPRYPFFILAVMQTLEGLMPNIHVEISSHAHCYYVLILSRLVKSGIGKSDKDINPCLNFARELAYAKYVGKEDFNFSDFLSYYKENFQIKGSAIKCMQDKTYGLLDQNGGFRTKYTYYYFLGEYLAQNAHANADLIEDLCEKSYSSENHLILIFLVHHKIDKDIIDSILVPTMCALDNFPVAKLEREETEIFYGYVAQIKENLIAESKSVAQERQKERKMRDRQERAPDNEPSGDNDIHNNIYRIGKNNDLLKQILYSQYGNMGKKQIADIIETVTDSRLRLVGVLLFTKQELEHCIQHIKKRHPQADEEKLAYFLNSLSFAWTMHNIGCVVNTIKFPEIKGIVDDVISKNPTPAYELIGYCSKLYISQSGLTGNIISDLKRLLKKNKGDAFYEKVLSLCTQRYILTHTSKASLEQKACSLLGITYKHRPPPRQRNPK